MNSEQSVHELKFLHPAFIQGENTTIRRGIKWNIRDGETVKIVCGEMEVYSKIHTVVMRFCDLSEWDIALQHDEETRNINGLLKAMRRAYPDFDEREIVTVVHFEMSECSLDSSGVR